MMIVADYFGGVDPYLTLYPTIIARYVGVCRAQDQAQWSADLNGASYLGAAFGKYPGYRVPFSPSLNCSLVPVVIGAPGAAASGAKVSSGVSPGISGSIASSASSIIGSVISAIAAAQAQKQENLSVTETAICQAETSLNTYGPAIDALIASGQVDAETAIEAYSTLIAQLVETMTQTATPATAGAIQWTTATMYVFRDVTAQFYADLANARATAAAAPASPSVSAQLSTAIASPMAATSALVAATGASPLTLLGIAAAVILFLAFI